MTQYQQLEMELSAAHAERNENSKKLLECEYANEKLLEKLKAKPPTVKVPIADQIDQTELDEIKEKALEETERKFQIRMNRQRKK